MFPQFVNLSNNLQKKPPLGIVPKHINDHKRSRDIVEAVNRYFDAGYPIPIEWITEYNELTSKERETK